METVYEVGGKTFLTSAFDQDSSVSWNVCVDVFRHGDIDIGSMLKIRDCHKLVSLEFFTEKDSQYPQRIEKIDTLINELLTFKQAYIEGWARRQETNLWQPQSQRSTDHS